MPVTGHFVQKEHRQNETLFTVDFVLHVEHVLSQYRKLSSAILTLSFIFIICGRWVFEATLHVVSIKWLTIDICLFVPNMHPAMPSSCAVVSKSNL